MKINVTFDQSLSSLPAGFVACVDAACNYYDQLFTNNATINIHVGYHEINGFPLINTAGESESSYSTSVTYAQLSSALASLATPGSSSLPVTSPFSGTMTITTADEKALGLISTTGSAVDGYLGFNNPLLTKLFYDPTHTLAIPTGYYDFMGIFEHELSEVMGRVSTINGSGAYSPLAGC